MVKRQKIPHLIFIQLTVFVFLFAFVLKRNDDKTNEDIDHEKSDYDDVDEIENGDDRTMVVNGTVVFSFRVDASVHQPVIILSTMAAPIGL